MTILIVEGLARVYRKAGSIAVVDEENNRVEVSLPDLELVVIVGECVRITSSAIITLLSQGAPVVFLSGRSDAYGVLFDVVQIGSVTIREAQYNCFSSTSCRLAYSKPVILSKLKGLYNVLRYEYKYYKEQLKDFEQLKYSILEVIESVKNASDVDELRNLEAQGSRYFWSLASNLIPEKYGFTGRKPRGGDVINSAIDFTYAVLYGIVTKAIVSAGLDPFYGMMHTTKPGRVSLTYDLSEVFKPIAVHAVIQASRKANLKTFAGSKLLKPKSIEVLVRHLYYRLYKESENLFKRKSIWYLPIREVQKFKDSLLKNIAYEPYIYDPTP